MSPAARLWPQIVSVQSCLLDSVSHVTSTGCLLWSPEMCESCVLDLLSFQSCRACQHFSMADPFNPFGVSPWLFPWGHFFCQPPHRKHPYITSGSGFRRVREVKRMKWIPVGSRVPSSILCTFFRGEIKALFRTDNWAAWLTPRVEDGAFTVFGCEGRNEAGCSEMQLEPLHDAAWTKSPCCWGACAIRIIYTTEGTLPIAFRKTLARDLTSESQYQTLTLAFGRHLCPLVCTWVSPLKVTWT
jgi:hypothetical protein